LRIFGVSIFAFEALSSQAIPRLARSPMNEARDAIGIEKLGLISRGRLCPEEGGFSFNRLT
jgi:hypothetical protein